MKITTNSRCPDKSTESLFINGQHVGEVIRYFKDDGSVNKYHAALKIPGITLSSSRPLIQGFSENSIEEAVMNAIRDGRDEHKQALQAIDAFEATLESETVEGGAA